MSFEEETALVIGYNARPLARLAKKLKLGVVAVDFWGDTDIRGHADILFTVQNPVQGESLAHGFEAPVAELLSKLARRAFQECEGIDFVILGSGLDDRPDLWQELDRLAPVMGCSPETLREARNFKSLYSRAERLGVFYPRTSKASEAQEALEIAKNIGFPVVLKALSSSGGFRHELAHGPGEVEEKFGKAAGRIGRAYVQQYVRGVDVSSSVLCDGGNCVVVSVNQQLIGVRELGVESRFGYSGNIVPLNTDEKIVKEISEVSVSLGEELGLVGSNGFDFVVDKEGRSHLIEINPRIQGTLECVYYATDWNLVAKHLDACRGYLPETPPEMKRYAVKMIVFSRNQYRLPDLRGMEGIFDVPWPGIVVGKGEPVCTVQVTGDSRSEALSKAWKRVRSVYDAIEGSSSCNGGF